MGRKRIVGLLAAAGAVAGLVLLVPPPATDAPASKRSPQVSDSQAGRPVRGAARARGDGQPAGQAVRLAGLDATRCDTAQGAKAAPAAPTPPPMPYRVAGQVVQDGAAHVVLSSGDRVLTVRAGEKLDDGYVVESINAEGVTLLYEPLGVRQQLPFVSALGVDAPLAKTALAPSQPAPAQGAAQAAPAQAGGERPARLRWDGPERVRAGDTFDVALRVTSERPVRASPLQLVLRRQAARAGQREAGRFLLARQLQLPHQSRRLDLRRRAQPRRGRGGCRVPGGHLPADPRRRHRRAAGSPPSPCTASPAAPSRTTGRRTSAPPSSSEQRPSWPAVSRRAWPPASAPGRG